MIGYVVLVCWCCDLCVFFVGACVWFSLIVSCVLWKRELDG